MKSSAYSNVDKGIKFEIWTAKLLRDLGYDRVKIGLPPVQGKSGAWHQIDIVYGLLRMHPVECKYKGPNGWKVSYEEVNKFVDTLKDLRIPPRRALFAACGYYDKEATHLANSVGLEIWDYDKLEKLDIKRLGPTSWISAKIMGRKPIRKKILETKISPELRQYYAIMVKKYGGC